MKLYHGSPHLFRQFELSGAGEGTTLLRCTHKLDRNTGEHTISFRSSSPGSRFAKRRFLRGCDEAPALVEALTFAPDVYFFDAPEAGLLLAPLLTWGARG